MGKGDELAVNEDKIKKSEGFRIHKKMKDLDVSKYVFEKNHEELCKTIDLFKSDYNKAIKRIKISQGKGLNPFLYEISRLLHNYLASGKTLIDHSRKIFQDEYEHKHLAFSEVYQNKIKEIFVESPLAKFIQDIRNYSVHRSIPISGASYEIASSNRGLTEVFLVKKNLLEWDRWTKKAKEYLNACEEEIDLVQLINEYTEKVKAFQEWFRSKQMEIHKKDFDEIRALEQENTKRIEAIFKRIDKDGTSK
ncbi:hypothetical protein VSK91_19640 [Bacillus swezeyi]|uniref:hypothetical protein n=1 Tax=Bacillus swezeyi TaxID=1925020 RepID=UPI0039C6622F